MSSSCQCPCYRCMWNGNHTKKYLRFYPKFNNNIFYGIDNIEPSTEKYVTERGTTTIFIETQIMQMRATTKMLRLVVRLGLPPYRSVLEKSVWGLQGEKWRGLSTAAPNGLDNGPNKSAVDGVMNMASNKATRFVYLRTLPLVKQAELDGMVGEVAANIEEATRAVCEKHACAIEDDRSAVHLHTTALAIGTHRVLSTLIQNEIRVNEMIRAGFGASIEEGEAKKRPDFWLIRMALWFSWDRMGAIRRMTTNMVRDFGSTFETNRVDTEDQGVTHRLIVKKCFYNDICRKEGLPHLTRIFCALDKAIYSPITVDSHGIDFELKQTLADKDATFCDFKFTKRQEDR